MDSEPYGAAFGGNQVSNSEMSNSSPAQGSTNVNRAQSGQQSATAAVADALNANATGDKWDVLLKTTPMPAGPAINPSADLAVDQTASRAPQKAEVASTDTVDNETATVVSGQSSALAGTPVPPQFFQDPKLQSAKVGVVAPNKSYAGMMKDSSGHSTGPAVSSQSATKAGASDKTALSQQNGGRGISYGRSGFVYQFRSGHAVGIR